jgi:hypothetical protein
LRRIPLSTALSACRRHSASRARYVSASDIPRPPSRCTQPCTYFEIAIGAKLSAPHNYIVDQPCASARRVVPCWCHRAVLPLVASSLCRVAASWELDIRNPRFADIASSLLERPSIMKPGLSLLIGMFSLTSMVIAAAADEPHTQRIRIDAEPPQNPEHQQVYDVLTLGTSRAQLRSVTNIWKTFGRYAPGDHAGGFDSDRCGRWTVRLHSLARAGSRTFRCSAHPASRSI